MIKSFLKLGSAFSFTLPKQTSFLPLASQFYFSNAKPAAKPAGKGGNAPPPKADAAGGSKGNPNVDPNVTLPHRFPILPPRDPLEPGEAHIYEKMPENEILAILGQTITKPKHSAYVSVERKGIIYHLYDAQRIPFGKMCQSIAYYLQGKNKPFYRHDTVGFGDVCVVVNASKMKFTGKKLLQKTVKYHSGFIGGFKEVPYSRFVREKPEQLLFRVISKMLPKNRLRYKYLDKLHVFRDRNHTMTGVLPNFGQFTVSYDHIYERFKAPSKEAGDVVVWQDVDGGPEEYKDLPRALDPSIEVPFKDRAEAIRTSPHNRKVWKEYKKYERRLRRYKEYKVKEPKDRSLDKAWEKGDSVMINRDWKIKKYGFEQMYLEAEDEPDDE